VFGTIGWIVANLVISNVFAADSQPLQFYVTARPACYLGCSAWRCPTRRRRPRQGGFRPRNPGLDALRLLKEWSFAVFVIGSFFICIPLAAYYAYAQLFVAKVGFGAVAGTMSWGKCRRSFSMLLVPWFSGGWE